MKNQNVFSVYEISRHLRQVIESSIEPVYVKGEISNYLHHNSGHIYFNLKDEHATLRCTFFRGANYALNFKPADGQSVICFGKLTLYEKGGSYNLNVQSMSPAGLGEMQVRFEELKKKLQAEGLFDPAKKQKIPPYPETIGIVTSPTSAALQDIINILNRRYPIDAFVYPALVQGSEAAQTLVRGIQYFNEQVPVDLIIIARGGGSQEDLFCFNDEALARSIFASRIPVISAVGHEIDYTISDFVADLRAPTPSAAAELAVPDKNELISYLSALKQRFNLLMESGLNQKQARLKDNKHLLAQYHPQRLWQELQQRFDMATLSLGNIHHQLKEPHIRLQAAKSRFYEQVQIRLFGTMQAQQHRLQNSQTALNTKLKERLTGKENQLKLLSETLKQQSPKQVMEKGWILALKGGQVLRSVKDISVQDRLELQFYDGAAEAVVQSLEERSE